MSQVTCFRFLGQVNTSFSLGNTRNVKKMKNLYLIRNSQCWHQYASISGLSPHADKSVHLTLKIFSDYDEFAYNDMVLPLMLSKVSLHCVWTWTNKKIFKHPKKKNNNFFSLQKLQHAWCVGRLAFLVGYYLWGQDRRSLHSSGGKTLEFYKNLSICNRIGHSDFYLADEHLGFIKLHVH